MTFFGRIVRELDIMSPTPAFNVSGRDRIQSKTGGVFVILSFMTLVAYIAFVIWDYFRFQLESATQLQSNASRPPSVDLEKNHLLPVVSLINTLTGEYIPPENYRDYFDMYLEMDRTSQTTGQNGLQSLNLVPCSTLKKDYYDSLFKDLQFEDDEAKVFLDYGLCVDPTGNKVNTTVEGFLNRKNTVSAKLRLYPCSETRSQVCQNRSPAETFELLNGLKVIVGFIIPEIDVYNFRKPLVYSLHMEHYYYLKDTLTTHIELPLQHIFLTDNHGPMLTKENATKAIRFGEEKERTTARSPPNVKCSDDDLKNCKEYMILTIYSSTSELQIVRRYKAILDVLGTVGGLKEIILIFFALLFRIVYGKSHQQDIVKYVYGVEVAENKNGWCKKKKESIEDKYKVEVISNPVVNGQDQDPDHKKSASPLEASRILLSESMADKAFKSIEESLDVFSLVKELNKIKLLLPFILNNEQSRAWQLCYLNKYLARQKGSEAERGEGVKRQPTEELIHFDTQRRTFNEMASANKEHLNEQGDIGRQLDEAQETPIDGKPNMPRLHVRDQEERQRSDVLMSPAENQEEAERLVQNKERPIVGIRQEFAELSQDWLRNGQLRPWSYEDLQELFWQSTRPLNSESVNQEDRISPVPNKSPLFVNKR